jgi:hypothetical protein
MLEGVEWIGVEVKKKKMYLKNERKNHKKKKVILINKNFSFFVLKNMNSN